MLNFAYALLFFIPFERIPSFEFHGVTIRATVVLLMVAFFTVLPHLAKLRRLGPVSLLDKAILIYLVVAVLSSAFASVHGRSIEVLGFLSAVLFGYFILSRILRNGFDSLAILRVIITSGTTVSLFGLYQFFADGLGAPLMYTGLAVQYSKAVFGFPRVQSVSLEPLYFANFLLLPLFLLGTFLLTLERRPRWYELASLYVMFTAFCLTLSRGGYAGILGGTVVLAVFFLAKQIRIRNVTLVGLLVVVSIASALLSVKALAGTKAVSTFGSQAVISDNKSVAASVTPRLNNYTEAWQLFKTRPVIGIGIGNYGVLNTVSPHVAGQGYMIVNNQYLETLAETGVLGLIALASVVVITFRELWRLTPQKKDRWLTFALAATLGGILVQYNFLSTIYIFYVWAIIALVDGLTYKQP
jgi:O-antigen ligase